jgi:hypothetical protein
MAAKPQDPPTIDLDAVRLRPLRAADAAAVYAYLQDPAVTQFTVYSVLRSEWAPAQPDAAADGAAPGSWAPMRQQIVASHTSGVGSSAAAN